MHTLLATTLGVVRLYVTVQRDVCVSVVLGALLRTVVEAELQAGS